MQLLTACTVVAALAFPARVHADPTQAELLQRLRKLEENQAQLNKEQAELREQLKAKDARIDSLQAELHSGKGTVPAGTESQKGEAIGDGMPAAAQPRKDEGALSTVQAAPAPAAPPEDVEEGPFGSYKQGRGFGFARTEWGEVRFGIYTYVRYLNQKGLDDHFTNGLGQKVHLEANDGSDGDVARITAGLVYTIFD